MSATACPAAPAACSRRPPLLSRLALILTRATALVRQRRSLGRLDAHELRDIGVTAAQARTEAARPVWDAPAHWRSGDGA